MTEKLQGIVIDVTRHTDRNDIVTLFTRSHGRISFISPVGSGKSARMRRSRLLPLSVIETDVTLRPNAELQRLGTFAPGHVWTDIYFHPVKQILSLFLSEFLNRLLRATMPDENLWDYIFGSLRLLDRMEDGVADFHIAFLISLLPFTGIQPDSTRFHPGMVFDFRSGSFSENIPPHRDYLAGDDASYAARLCRVDFSNVKALRLSGALRSRILEGLLHYYGIHFPGTSNLKSLPVVRDIFHS